MGSTPRINITKSIREHHLNHDKYYENSSAAILELPLAVEDLRSRRSLPAGGALLPCYGHQPSTPPEGKPSYYANLYSGKHHTFVHNLQVLID